MPKQDRYQFFPLYAEDILYDDKVELMNAEQFGAYCFLLFRAWVQKPPCSVPDSNDTLARWAHLSHDRWLEIKTVVMSPFRLMSDGRWYQSRMQREYDKLNAKMLELSRSGRRGSISRWGDSANLAQARLLAFETEEEHEWWYEQRRTFQDKCPGCNKAVELFPTIINPNIDDVLFNLQPLCSDCIESKQFKGIDLRKKWGRNRVANAMSSEIFNSASDNTKQASKSGCVKNEKIKLKSLNLLIANEDEQKWGSNAYLDIDKEEEIEKKRKYETNEARIKRKEIERQSVEVFEFWHKYHPGAKFGSNRKRKIEGRLREGYSVQQLKDAISGNIASSFHNGENVNGTKYQDIELICRNGSKVEMFLQYLEESQRLKPIQPQGANNGNRFESTSAKNNREQLEVIERLQSQLQDDGVADTTEDSLTSGFGPEDF